MPTLSDVIVVTMRQGFQIAKPVSMPDEATVRIVREYARPEFKTKPDKQDKKRIERTELAYLKDQVARLKDQVRRLSEEVESEIKMLTSALNDDKQESIGQVERRISRLKGALEYRGRSDFVTTER